MTDTKNENFFITFISIIVTMCMDFLYGIKFIFIDAFGIVYYILSGKVDTIYKSAKSSLETNKQSKFEKWYNNLPIMRAQRRKREELKRKFNASLADDKRMDEPTVFKFTARDQDGRMVTSTFTGLSKQEVNAFLLNEGYEVYNIETSKQINFLYGSSSLFKVHVTNKDLIFWLTQLSTYLKAGITLVDSVRILSSQMRKGSSKKRIFDSIVYELVRGNSFSGALEKLGHTFPSLMINMIKAAEATGELPETLEDLASYYSELDKTKKQMISAASYPAAITVFALGVVVFILLYVIPRFVKIYNAADIEINGLTLTIINISEFIKTNYVLLISGVAGTLLVLWFLYQYVKAARGFIQVILMRLPVISKVIIYNEITIFTKTFSSLLKNNVYITDSIDILSRVTRNEVYKDIMYRTISNISAGERISNAFRNHWAVPSVAYHMIVTGEETGELALMMQKVSEYYQEMHRNIVNNLKSFIEPIMIVTLAIVVGVIILAVIIPMFDLYGSINFIIPFVLRML